MRHVLYIVRKIRDNYKFKKNEITQVEMHGKKNISLSYVLFSVKSAIIAAS
jgi:hypothetical protein